MAGDGVRSYRSALPSSRDLAVMAMAQRLKVGHGPRISALCDIDAVMNVRGYQAASLVFAQRGLEQLGSSQQLPALGSIEALTPVSLGFSLPGMDTAVAPIHRGLSTSRRVGAEAGWHWSRWIASSSNSSSCLCPWWAMVLRALVCDQCIGK
jgi:hypothetical protein